MNGLVRIFNINYIESDRFICVNFRFLLIVSYFHLEKFLLSVYTIPENFVAQRKVGEGRIWWHFPFSILFRYLSVALNQNAEKSFRPFWRTEGFAPSCLLSSLPVLRPRSSSSSMRRWWSFCVRTTVIWFSCCWPRWRVTQSWCFHWAVGTAAVSLCLRNAGPLELCLQGDWRQTGPLHVWCHLQVVRSRSCCFSMHWLRHVGQSHHM